MRVTAILPFLPALGCCGSWEVGYSFPAPSRQTNGLTFDGRYLWHSNDNEPLLYQINPVGGGVVATLPTFVPDQGDLAFAGGAVWAVSENLHYIHKIDPKSGKTLDSIFVLGVPIGSNRPGSRDSVQIEGLTSDGRYLWVDGGSNLLLKVDPVSRKQWMYEMPPEMGYLDGLTWAFDHLWVVTNNATIYELDPCTLGILDEFGAPARISGGPEGFAFDGENLWFADNDMDQIYKIILRDKLITLISNGDPGLFKAGEAQDGPCREGTLVTSAPKTFPQEDEEPVALNPRRVVVRPESRKASRAGWRFEGGHAVADALGRRFRGSRAPLVPPHPAPETAP